MSDLHSPLPAIVTWPCFRPLLGTAAPAAAEQNQQNIAGINNQLIIELVMYRVTIRLCPSHDCPILLDVMVGIGTSRWQTDSCDSFGKNDGHVQCNDGDIVGLILLLSKSNQIIHKFLFCIGYSTYVSSRVVLVVKYNFADFPRHLDFSDASNSNQYGHR